MKNETIINNMQDYKFNDFTSEEPEDYHLLGAPSMTKEHRYIYNQYILSNHISHHNPIIGPM